MSGYPPVMWPPAMLTRGATRLPGRGQRTDVSPGTGGQTNDGVIGGGAVKERYMPGWPVATGTGVGRSHIGASTHGAATPTAAGAATPTTAAGRYGGGGSAPPGGATTTPPPIRWAGLTGAGGAGTPT